MINRCSLLLQAVEHRNGEIHGGDNRGRSCEGFVTRIENLINGGVFDNVEDLNVIVVRGVADGV